MVPDDKTSSSGKKLKDGRFLLNIMKHFHCEDHRHRLPTEVVESPSLEVFKRFLDLVLGTLFWVSLLEQGVVGPDNLQRFL